MSRRTDLMNPLSREEIEDLMEQAERLHSLDVAWVCVALVAIVSAFMLFGEASPYYAAAAVLPFGGCGCAAGKEQCDCCGLEKVDSSSLDVGLLIASGAMEPPQITDSSPSFISRFWAWLQGPAF